MNDSRKDEEFAQTVLDKTDRNTREAWASTISKIIDEQADVRRLVEELASRMDNTRSEGATEAATQEEVRSGYTVGSE